MIKTTGLWPVVFLSVFFAGTVQAQPPAAPQAVIGIIIDDMGKRLETGRRVLALPGPVACAFLPRAKYTRELADRANQRGLEVLLHLPMDSVDGRPLDEGAVTLAMTESEFVGTVLDNLRRVPHVIGINNHMGSLLTRHPGHMRWLMEAIHRQGGPLFFVDSRTTKATV
ncbi:Putative periplasmic protein YibQ, distant homology with nucleoside diphosphatase and polysaccharide deacetylase, partial [hydrothermal vent metagenome]